MTISICMPTRGRPRRFMEATASARRLARNPIEVIAWVDDDDPALEAYQAMEEPWRRILVGPREVQSNLWNRCWAEATGDIAQLGADDTIYRSPGWDLVVTQAFEQFPDRIALVYGDDGSARREATLPFVSREWIETAGTFTPPYFKSWFADRWIWEVADMIDRRIFLRNLRIEHRHPLYGKAQVDETYREAERFRAEQDPKALYFRTDMLAERCEQALRLSRRITAERQERETDMADAASA